MSSTSRNIRLFSAFVCVLSLLAPLSVLHAKEEKEQQKIMLKKLSIPPGQGYVQSLHNEGESVRLSVSLQSNSAVSVKVMTLRAYTLLKGGLESDEGILLERAIDEAGTTSGDFTVGEGSCWIYVQNQANFPNEVELKVTVSDGKNTELQEKIDKATKEAQAGRVQEDSADDGFGFGGSDDSGDESEDAQETDSEGFGGFGAF